MVPGYIERLPIIPMTPSNKADRKNLPAPKGPRFVARDAEFVDPTTEMEKILANTLADTLKVDRISITDHFFQDLGAHSLLMAQFCSKLREQSARADVSMRDIYLHPTIGGLADLLESKSEAKQTRTVPENSRIPTSLEYYGCGALQYLFYVGYGLLLIGLVAVYLVPRVFNLFLTEGKTYVLFGLHHYIQGIDSAGSNSGPFNLLFGDGSYIVYYLKWVGYELNKIVQTRANFGLDQVHDNPFLCDVGSGTMVLDGLTMLNTEMSNTSFRLGKVKLGDRNYLGNNILVPTGDRTGSDVLLATKVMIPIDGPVRENDSVQFHLVRKSGKASIMPSD